MNSLRAACHIYATCIYEGGSSYENPAPYFRWDLIPNARAKLQALAGVLEIATEPGGPGAEAPTMEEVVEDVLSAFSGGPCGPYTLAGHMVLGAIHALDFMCGACQNHNFFPARPGSEEHIRAIGIVLYNLAKPVKD